MTEAPRKLDPFAFGKGECVKGIEALLERAKNGEIRAVFFVVVETKDGAMDRWGIGQYNVHEVTSGMLRLLHDIVHESDQ